MERIEYSDYSQEDATLDGITYTISSLSKKALFNGTVIGKIIIEDKSLELSSAFIDSTNDNEIKSYYKNLVKTKSYYLRKICFNNKFRFSGKLEDFFDYTMAQMPIDSLLWCVPSVCGEDIIQQLSGFVTPLYPIPNKLIRLFSLYV